MSTDAVLKIPRLEGNALSPLRHGRLGEARLSSPQSRHLAAQQPRKPLPLLASARRKQSRHLPTPILDGLFIHPYLPPMNAIVSEDGKISLPSELRENASLHPGDTLDVQFYKGTILLRKHHPLTPKQCSALFERSRSQPEPAAEDEAAVAQAIQEVRAARR